MIRFAIISSYVDVQKDYDLILTLLVYNNPYFKSLKSGYLNFRP